MGHPPYTAWGYTPRELYGWLQFYAILKKSDTAEQMSLQAMASRGDIKEVNKRIQTLSKE